MLYKGIFWIKDIDDIENSSICIKEQCSLDGIFINRHNINENLLSKSKDNFNHQKAWSTLSRNITDNKQYNYYPRGRVEIRNNKAIIYVNNNVINKDFKEWVIETFELYEDYGIKDVIIKCDGSKHYDCHLDMKRIKND